MFAAPNHRPSRRRGAVASAVLVTLFAVAFAAGARADERDDFRARDLERSILSPFCPGRTLYECPSPLAAEWRADIRQWVSEGESNQTIRARLQARAPDAELEGGGPAPLIVLGTFGLSLLLVILFVLRLGRRARSHEDVPPPRSAPDAKLDARLEEELAGLPPE